MKLKTIPRGWRATGASGERGAFAVGNADRFLGRGLGFVGDGVDERNQRAEPDHHEHRAGNAQPADAAVEGQRSEDERHRDRTGIDIICAAGPVRVCQNNSTSAASGGKRRQAFSASGRA